MEEGSQSERIRRTVVLVVAIFLGISTLTGATLGTATAPSPDTVDPANDTVDRTLDAGTGSNDEIHVTFRNCTTAEVVGHGTVYALWVGYFEYGGNYGKLKQTVDGGAVVRSPNESTTKEPSDDLVGTGETYLSYVKYETDDGTKRKVHNPYREACKRELRPEKVNVHVVDVTPVEDGAYEVTFGYENPNNFTVTATPPYRQTRKSLFVSDPADFSDRFRDKDTYRHANRSPPTEFEPGNHTFTVRWTPPSDDARLVWVLDMSAFLQPEWKNLTASTPPAYAVECEFDSNETEHHYRRGDSTTKKAV